jgi:Fic family protein
MDELEYAAAHQRVYGVNDAAYAELERNQLLLARFDVEPTAPRANRELLESVERERAALRAYGWAPSTSGNVFAKLRCDFVHTTAAYEGNTMTLADVSSVVTRGEVVPDHSLAEHLEVTDLAEAFDAAVAAGLAGEKLTVEAVLATHARAARHLPDAEPGAFRWDQRYVTSSRVLPPPPARVPALVDAAVAWYNEAPSLERVALFHLLFEDIHPFADGNGRTGRVLVCRMLAALGYPPVAFKDGKPARDRYYASIASFVADAAGRDGSAMVDLLAELVERSCSLELLHEEQRAAAGK